MRYHTKNLLRISLSIGLFVLLFLLPISPNQNDSHDYTQTAHAQTSCPTGQVPTGPLGECEPITSQGSCGVGETLNPITGKCESNQSVGGNPNASSTTPGTTGGGTQEEIDCDWNDVQCAIGKLFYYTIFVTFGILLYIAASFFDFIVQLSIIDFHKLVNLPGLHIAWTVLRDTMNITFIFLLLYASISMILGLGKEKGIIKGVILAGLLINFSFFFTSVIIDVSNITTVQMYEAVQKIGERASQTSTNSDVEYRATGITAVFMEGTGIQVGTISGLDTGDFVAAIFQQMIFSSIEFLVLAFVFFAMAFLLLGRLIVLLILLVTSPISVMGGLLPQLSQYSKQWWKEMINQAVFAPIMMLFLVVTAVIISNQEFRGLFSKNDMGGLVGGVQGLAQYAIVIGLLIVGIITAKQSAGAASNGAADWAIKKAQGIAKTPGRWAAGISGAVGRNTVGRLGKWAGEKHDLTIGKWSQANIADAKGWRKGLVPLKRGAAWTAKNTGIDEGLRDSFKDVAGLKFGSQANLAEREKQLAQRRREVGQAVRDDDSEQKIKAGIELSEKIVGTPEYSSNEKIKAYLDEVGKLTDKKIEEMLIHDLEQLQDSNFAGALNARQMDVIMKSDISDGDKKKIKDAQERGLNRRLGGTSEKGVPGTPGYVAATPVTQDAELNRILRGRPSDIAQLPTAVLLRPEVAQSLSGNVLGKILGGNMSDEDRGKIREIIEDFASQPNFVATNPAEQARYNNAVKAAGWLNSSDVGRTF